MSDTPKKIGDINGKWAILFRVTLVLVPLSIGLFSPWAVWVTTNQFADNSFRGEGERFTQSESERMMALLIEEVGHEQTVAHAQLRTEIQTSLREHAQKPWHDVMDQRVTALERDNRILASDINAINGKLDSLLVAVTELRSAIGESP